MILSIFINTLYIGIENINNYMNNIENKMTSLSKCQSMLREYSSLIKKDKISSFYNDTYIDGEYKFKISINKLENKIHKIDICELYQGVELESYVSK